MKTKGYFKSVIGGREKNQDAWLINDEMGLYAVADGVGGGLQGEVASQMSVDGLLQYRKEGMTMLEAFHRLQDEVYQEAMDSFGEALMGTTLSAIEFSGNKMSVCHVGDSRVYHYDGHLMRQLTEDQEVYDESMKGTVLNSYLGIDANIYPIRITQEIYTVQPGQRLILASDGLFKQLSDMQIVTMLREKIENPTELLDTLCREASKAEYSDNVTVVYVEIE